MINLSLYHMIAILLAAVLFASYGAYKIGVRVGWNASQHAVAAQILNAVGYDSLEEWQADIDKKDKER